MGIKETLAEEDANFVSLRSLLTQMCAAEGVTMQDAATQLLRLLRRREDAPEWHTWDRVDGVRGISRTDRPKASAALRHIADTGQPANEWEEMDSDIPF